MEIIACIKGQGQIYLYTKSLFYGLQHKFILYLLSELLSILYNDCQYGIWIKGQCRTYINQVFGFKYHFLLLFGVKYS